METRVYMGDKLVNSNGEVYIVAKPESDKFVLISMKTGNGWSYAGYKTYRETGLGKHYVTLENINRNSSRDFKPYVETPEVKVETKKVEKTVEITTLEIERVLSRGFITNQDAKPNDLLYGLANEVLDYLIEKGFVEEC